MIDRPPRSRRLRLVVAEDSGIVRAGLVRLLREADMTVCAEAEDVPGLLMAVAREQPDVAIVDVRLPPSQTDEGLRAAAQIVARHPNVGVLILSQHLESRVARELLTGAAGGVGYLLKDTVADIGGLTEALLRVAAGGTVVDPALATRLVAPGPDDRLASLSARELQVLALMAEGRTNTGIADLLSISPRTLETHVRTLLEKLALPPDVDGHRRVRAVLQYLDARSVG